jgi:hypothetical protein
MLNCPECLNKKNWYFHHFTPDEDQQVAVWRLQAAFRLRASLKGLAFYANRAKKERERSGSEMPYWLGLQGSSMTAERPAPRPDSILGLTPEDLPDTLPFDWLHQVERIMLGQRQSTLDPGVGPTLPI